MNSLQAFEHQGETASLGQEQLSHQIADVLVEMHGRGVRLWSENGRLRYKAPRGALNSGEIERLKASKDEIVAFLEASMDAACMAPPRLERRASLTTAPLNFSQRTHRNWHRLDQRRSVRQLAMATRLRGPLDVTLLRGCVDLMVERHESLRTQIVVIDGMPMQQILERATIDVPLVDFSSLSAACKDAAVTELIERLILEPVDLHTDPLAVLRLARLAEKEHVLIVAMEHMISDAASMSIFFRELMTLYREAARGDTAVLPPIHIQFADYATWQNEAQRWWWRMHGGYWQERLAGAQRLRFPQQQAACDGRRGWGTVPLRISKERKAELREWCRSRRTTLVMSVFTVYVALVMRWCGLADAVVRYQIDGRTRPEVENAIGFFAAALHLRIELHDEDSLLDLMNRVTLEYCASYERADHSYIEAQVPTPPYARNGRFNWVPQETDAVAGNFGDDRQTLDSVAFPFVNPVLKTFEFDGEPSILFYDTAEGVTGGVNFPLNRFSDEEMTRFAQAFLVLLDALLRQPQLAIASI